jgi:hypothetical protein
MLSFHAATNIFLLGLFFPVMLCFIRGKRTAQVAQVFREMIHTHLVEVIPSLLIGHDYEPQHFFSG